MSRETKKTSGKIDVQWLFRAIALMILDACFVVGAYFCALLIRFDFMWSRIPNMYAEQFKDLIIPYVLTVIAVLYMCRLYHSIWSFASMNELVRIICAHGIIAVMDFLIVKIMHASMPISFYLIGFLLSFVCVTCTRFMYRFVRMVYIMLQQRGRNYGDERVMVIGAGSAGKTIIHEMFLSKHLSDKVCCVIDDNPAKIGKNIDGVPIVGGRETILRFVREYDITKIIYAIPTANKKDQSDILNICKETGCKLMTVPGIYQLIEGEVSLQSLREVDLLDLLGRDPIVVNNEEIHDLVAGKVVMVTGAGGSIGSELSRQIAKEHPKLLILFDIYENNVYDVQQELRKKYPLLQFETLIGSVRNTNRVKWVLNTYKPEIIYHAAAHKHVPLMEDSPNEAIKNNVFGTYKLGRAAMECGVKRFVLISTDKAVNPTNIMGASKRLCEMVVQMLSRQGKTEFVAVRFGNVLGSNGSVVPLFKRQIAAGGPVTVTHPDITRFFMTIPEAVSLVLQASIYAQGGEIFILDMGEPVKIDDMARNLIKLSGYEPDVDIKIEYTGLRPGEKLYEEILMSEEGLKETPNKLIHIGKPIEMEDDVFQEELEQLEKACKKESSDIKKIVAKMVPTYHMQEN